MHTYGVGERVAIERTGIRDPFRKALTSGLIEGWRGCIVLDDMPVCGAKTAPDLLALRQDGTIALIECKRASSGQAKKGMFEQVLMYGEILSPLLEADKRVAFEAQCRKATSWSSDAALVEFIQSAIPRTMHLWIVVDRWSGRMDQTALHTWNFLNRALEREGRPPIRVWAVGRGGVPVDVAAARADWVASRETTPATFA